MNESGTAEFTERKACISCGGSKLNELSSGRFDEGTVKRFFDEDPWGEHPGSFLKGKRWSFVECQDCDLAFHRYILAPEWNERRFSRWMSQAAIEAFEKSHKTPASEFKRAVGFTSHVLQIEKLTRSLRGGKAVRLLDFGCGYGDFLSMCSLYGFEACGIDRSSARRDNGSFAKIYADIDAVAAMAPFHALTLFEVLEHLDDPRGVLLQLRGLLPPGGILVLETPNCAGVRGIETRDDYAKIHPLEHINGFIPATLIDFAERLGFASLGQPISCMASGPKEVVKYVAKGLLKPLMKPTTQLYFRKL